MRRRLKASEVNHLRRLLGWVRCEVGQSPDEFVATVRSLNPAIWDGVSESGKQRLVESYQRKSAVPKYIRAAIKALEPLVHEDVGEVIDTAIRKPRRLVHRHAALNRPVLIATKPEKRK